MILGMMLGESLLSSPAADAQPYFIVSPPLSIIRVFVGGSVEIVAFLLVEGVDAEDLQVEDLAVFFRFDAEDDGALRRFLAGSLGGDGVVTVVCFVIVEEVQ